MPGQRLISAETWCTAWTWCLGSRCLHGTDRRGGIWNPGKSREEKGIASKTFLPLQAGSRAPRWIDPHLDVISFSLEAPQPCDQLLVQLAALSLPETRKSTRNRATYTSESPTGPSIVLCRQKGLKDPPHCIQLADTGEGDRDKQQEGRKSPELGRRPAEQQQQMSCKPTGTRQCSSSHIKEGKTGERTFSNIF